MESRQAKRFFKGERNMPVTVAQTRPAYDSLLEVLRGYGTEIFRDRRFEVDDSFPGGLVHQGRVEFIFPPQPDVEKSPDNPEIALDVAGRYITEKAILHFDKSLVEGFVVVDYYDANNFASLSVEAVRGDLAAPDEVLVAIDEAFAVFQPIGSVQ